MEYKFVFLDKTYSVILRKTDDRCQISVDGNDYDIIHYSIYGNMITFKSDKGLNNIYFAQDKDTIHLAVNGDYYSLAADRGRSMKNRDAGVQQTDSVSSPMPGLLVKVTVRVGDKVEQGATLAIVEAMKMQNELRASRDGIVKRINNNEGDQIEALKPIVELE